MDRRVLSLKKGFLRSERGVALLTAFSISLVLLILIASLYWITVQRHVLMRKRAQHAKGLYLAEAGMNDAIARLRIGVDPPVINPAVGKNYCLDVEDPMSISILAGCVGTCTPPADVRVCVDDDAGDDGIPGTNDNNEGRNPINVTASF